MASSRSEHVAAFYARHARGLERSVTRQVADVQSANDACARAWELLLERPQIELDHHGLKWLQTTAVHEAWRQHSRHTAGVERLDAELDGGDSVGEQLVGRGNRVEQRLEAQRRLALIDELPADQRRRCCWTLRHPWRWSIRYSVDASTWRPVRCCTRRSSRPR